MSDGAHVMIQLIGIGGQGAEELDILRYFSQKNIAEDPRNHVLPLLEEICLDDLTFVVLPLLREDGLVRPDFHDAEERLEAMRQTFEVTRFLPIVYPERSLQTFLLLTSGLCPLCALGYSLHSRLSLSSMSMESLILISDRPTG